MRIASIFIHKNVYRDTRGMYHWRWQPQQRNNHPKTDQDTDKQSSG
jgi:hypothetical protein